MKFDIVDYGVLVVSVLLAILFFCIALSGCSMLSGQKANTEITVPPTPGVQLWTAAKKSNWLVTMSILGIAGGVFALASGAVKLGTASIASASVSLFMSLAVARFALWMAVFGLIGSLAAALFSILARKRALVEIITGVQTIKDVSLDPEDVKTVLDNTQSNTTKTIVGNIKNELKLAGKI